MQIIRFILPAAAMFVVAAPAFAAGIAASSSVTPGDQALNAVDAFRSSGTAPQGFVSRQRVAINQPFGGGTYQMGVFLSRMSFDDGAAVPFTIQVLGVLIQRQIIQNALVGMNFGRAFGSGSGVDNVNVTQLEVSMLIPLFWRGVFFEFVRSALLSPTATGNQHVFWQNHVGITVASGAGH